MRCFPLVEPIATQILTLGQFSNDDTLWHRIVREENTQVSVKFDAESLLISLSPVISRMEDHAAHRTSAAIMFEIGWRYVEKVHGEMEQQSTVGECLTERPSMITIARYPDMPLRWEQVCLGFRSVFIGEGHV